MIKNYSVGQAGAYDTIKLEDANLYNLIRRSKDYKITRFVKVWNYKDSDGSTVKLYDFKYALIPDEPEKLVMAGGMSLDSKARIHGVDAWQFAVREKDGKVISTAFMGSDFYYSPSSDGKFSTEDTESQKAAKSRINSTLALTEKTT